jgi:hypothetical protein
MPRRGYVIAWRETIRDSELSPTAKLVGFVLSTYMNAKGEAHPSKATLARGASVSVPTIKRTLRELDRGKYLTIATSGGRFSNWYRAAFPTGSFTTPLTGSPTTLLDDSNGVKSNTQRDQTSKPTGSPMTPEVVEIEKRSRRREISNCTTCGGLLDEDNYCDECRHVVAA